jgi:hypothetical protein
MSKPYKLTLADLRKACPLLATIEVTGHGPEYGCSHSMPGTEELVGKNQRGEIVVRVKGKVSPANVQKFRNSYQFAVSAGVIKKPSIPTEEEPT